MWSSCWSEIVLGMLGNVAVVNTPLTYHQATVELASKVCTCWHNVGSIEVVLGRDVENVDVVFDVSDVGVTCKQTEHIAKASIAHSRSQNASQQKVSLEQTRILQFLSSHSA